MLDTFRFVNSIMLTLHQPDQNNTQTKISDKSEINFWNEMIIIPRCNMRPHGDRDQINTMSETSIQAYSG